MLEHFGVTGKDVVMTDPKFMKPWHGVPRESINWHPEVNEACGTCVTGCNRMVYCFDYLSLKEMGSEKQL